APSTAAMPTSRRNPSRRESRVAVPTVATLRASDMKGWASARIIAAGCGRRHLHADTPVLHSGVASASSVAIVPAPFHDLRKPNNSSASRPDGPMTNARYDVLGIGNAIVDVIARAEDDFLARQGMHKGAMTLIDEDRAQQIYAAMGPAIE